MSEIEILLAALFFAVAVLYSSVGHAGASGYIASMALLGFAPEQMRPTALALNLLVGGIGLFRWWRGGHVRWRNVLPFVLASAPAAFFVRAGQAAEGQLFDCCSASCCWSRHRRVPQRLARGSRRRRKHRGRRVPWLAGLLIGAAIGVLSGLTGTGGAIFLTPLLLFARWMPTREASGTSVAFVWINSLTGLAGLLHASGTLPQVLPMWLVAVAIGAAARHAAGPAMDAGERAAPCAGRGAADRGRKLLFA